jgi:hypothetical protein
VPLAKWTKGRFLEIKTLRAQKRRDSLLHWSKKLIERHERGHSNSKTRRDVEMPESTGRNSIKHSGEIKEKGEVVSACCGLQTYTRNRSVTVLEIGRLLTVWIEDCNKKTLHSSNCRMKI